MTGGGGITVPEFVALELMQGCRNRVALDAVERLLQRHQTLWPSEVDLRRSLQRFGGLHLSHGLSAFDALIAETAIGAGATLHTFNVKHYSAVPGLTTIQPYIR